ncbi:MULTISPECIES: DeoR/GlpR family DNA-binding transcription regulator [unclassified Gilliamella]|uniref:DeoR/GlpR family DNA-binding transcription regulator n=1 Tax=unclassified Gilliamella TaxID=2685620 RepID=UPI002269E47E|nr:MULTISPECIES: DeoR/GlpR family DNA-binding transcription regulator [unclassified Gilliamella]MCX8583941.1 DeoR/GlpR transcriptional regulator [Gilliamella sp. B3372]MCX8594608.1 DeoR/GlpR transcriptional regulator [Gilliamella sp. B3367]
MQLMNERRELILEDLITAGTVYVSELARKYDVSYETIRKDLSQLEEKGFLVKCHGGATLKQGAIEHPFQIREKENASLKKSIAQKALSLLPDNCSMIIGTGSTTLELAKLLCFRSGYKIFTDSLPVANTLIASDNQVFLFGGELRNKSSSVFGGWALSMISEIQVDVCFLGTDGFANLAGPSSPSSSDACIDKAIIAHADKRYILGDYTKFNRKSLFKICNWDEITALITNDAADVIKVAELQKQTNVILC